VDLVERVDELSQACAASRKPLLLEESPTSSSPSSASWRRLTADGTMEFSRAGLKQISALCRLMAVKNPLVKRGLNLRAVYVWGLGLQLSARAVGGEDGEQDVNAVVQAFLDDPGNKAVLCSDQAHEEKERSLGTDGNVFVVCFTLPKAGRVQVRTILFEEVEDIICRPGGPGHPLVLQAPVAAGHHRPGHRQPGHHHPRGLLPGARLPAEAAVRADRR
jgi:hypothetical protein